MRAQFRLALPAASMLVALAGAAQAVELTACIIEFAPWGFIRPRTLGGVDEVGVMFDMIKEFERRSPHSIVRKLLPYARVEVELEYGGCDFALMAWSDSRARYAKKGTVFLPLEFGVIAVTGMRLQQYDDLKALTISVARGLKIAPRFDQDETLAKSMDRDNLTGVRKAAMQRTTAVAGSITTLRWLISELGVTKQFGDTLVLQTNDFASAYSKRSKHPELEQAVNSTFKGLVSDGTAASIYRNWVERKPVPADPKVVW
jgi:polar amino acid transport system substrate-binding protein